jgi:hypothetical protein
MANNPHITQGNLNRVRATVLVNSNATLNITPPYLGKAGISVAFEGDANSIIPAMTGIVNSPEPYIIGTIAVDLLKTNGIAEIWREQMENSALIGNVVIIPDTSALVKFTFTNCSIVTVGDMPFNGTSAGWGIVIKGQYDINNAMWNP